MDSYDIGERIRLLMEIKGIKRSYLAEKLDITYNTLTKKLNGQRKFNLEEAQIIKKELNLPLEMANNVFFNPKFDLQQYIFNSLTRFDTKK